MTSFFDEVYSTDTVKNGLQFVGNAITPIVIENRVQNVISLHQLKVCKQKIAADSTMSVLTRDILRSQQSYNAGRL